MEGWGMEGCRDGGWRKGWQACKAHLSLICTPAFEERVKSRLGPPGAQLRKGPPQSAGRGGDHFSDGLLLPGSFVHRGPPCHRCPWRSDSRHRADVAGRLPHGCPPTSLAVEPQLCPGVGRSVPHRPISLNPLVALDAGTRHSPGPGSTPGRVISETETSWVVSRGVPSPLGTLSRRDLMPREATDLLLPAEVTVFPTSRSYGAVSSAGVPATCSQAWSR